MQYSEDDYQMISGIQHYVFCKRQWALIHIEDQWAENLRTVEGDLLHERAHNEKLSEKRDGKLITRGIRVFSRELGITGVCDVVEFEKDEKGITLYVRKGKYIPIPIEYKRGKPKKDKSDELQLCAQAVCLEGMLVCHIPKGYLFYGETKRRLEIEFNEELRNELSEILNQMHELFKKRYTPKVKTGKHCRACSIKDICLPKLCNAKKVSDYIESRLEGGA